MKGGMDWQLSTWKSRCSKIEVVELRWNMGVHDKLQPVLLFEDFCHKALKKTWNSIAILFHCLGDFWYLSLMFFNSPCIVPKIRQPPKNESSPSVACTSTLRTFQGATRSNHFHKNTETWDIICFFKPHSFVSMRGKCVEVTRFVALQ